MNILINKNTLETIVNQSQNFLEKKDISQITSCIFLEAKNNTLIIKATDYEIGIKITLTNINIIEEGKTTFSGKKIFDIVKNFKEEEISIKTNDKQTIIKQNKTIFKLPSMISDEFPDFPTKENKKNLNIENYDISSILKTISISIDNNNPKYELNGMLLDINSNKISFVSTDTKRLSISTISNNNEKEVHRVIIPKKTIYEIIKLFSKNVNIFFDKVNLIIEKNNIFFYSKLINGQYPEFQKIIPKEYSYKVNLNKAELITAINIIQSVSNNIKMIFKERKIFFENLDNTNIEAKTEIEINETIEISIALNGKFILDFINSIQEDLITLKVTDENSPIELETKNAKAIIMTIKEFN